MGDYAEQLVKNCAVPWLIAPADHTGAATSGVPISLKMHDHVTILIATGAWGAGTCAVTVTQDVSVTPTAAVKALPFTHYWTNDAAVGSSALVDTVCVNTFNLDTANAIYAIEIDTDSLDVPLNFDCIRLEIATPGQNAANYCALAVMSKTRYAGVAASIFDVTLD